MIHDGVRTVSGGHGFAGIGRMRMLQILQDRARELGVEMRFETPFTTAEEYRPRVRPRRGVRRHQLGRARRVRRRLPP